MLLVDETFDAAGNLVRVHLASNDGALVLSEANCDTVLDEAILTRTFEKLGRPLAEDVAPDGPSLALPSGNSLVHLRFLARFDVIAKDYLVLVRPAHDPLVVLAKTLVGALKHLASRSDPSTARSAT